LNVSDWYTRIHKSVQLSAQSLRAIHQSKTVFYIACSDGKGLPTDLLDKLKLHRWDRQPTEWSQ
jgi:hypothetical protein